MLDTIKKNLLTGVGMALRSKKEIESLAKEFAEQSEMNQQEAKAFLDDCRKRYDAARSNLDKKIEKTVESVLERMDLPSRADIDAVSKRMDDLAEKIKTDT